MMMLLSRAKELFFLCWEYLLMRRTWENDFNANISRQFSVSWITTKKHCTDVENKTKLMGSLVLNTHFITAVAMT